MSKGALGLIGTLSLALVLTFTVWPRHQETITPRYQVVQTCMAETDLSEQTCANLVEGLSK